ncbi:STAS domain-containing protein [Oceanobacillus massiliensis]|uniref:STAS domain-containing protein n=1 Tax=Oceanobacillus massiliensis TaxID=1465765 RepID=UPI000289FCAE|nr:STAS domain-containing protein [Oceanobacillus massiliensis]
MLKYSVLKDDSLYQVSLNGDLDIEGTEIINEEIMPELTDAESVNINFEEVPFVDSSGMGLLITLVNTLKENSIRVTISNVNEEVFGIFELLQLPEILGNEVFI